MGKDSIVNPFCGVRYPNHLPWLLLWFNKCFYSIYWYWFHGATWGKAAGLLKENVRVLTLIIIILIIDHHFPCWQKIHSLHLSDRQRRRTASTPHCLIALLIPHWFESSGSAWRGWKVLGGFPTETKLSIIVKDYTIGGRGQQPGKMYSANEKYPFRELLYWHPETDHLRCIVQARIYLYTSHQSFKPVF